MDWLFGREMPKRISKLGYIQLFIPEHPNARGDGYVFEHTWIVAKAMNKPVPEGSHIHHVNGVKSDNSPGNLVVCSDQYHKLLHYRQRAKAECGHANWGRCTYCKQWDDPANLKAHPRKQRYHHRSCKIAYDRMSWRRRHPNTGKDENGRWKPEARLEIAARLRGRKRPPEVIEKVRNSVNAYWSRVKAERFTGLTPVGQN